MDERRRSLLHKYATFVEALLAPDAALVFALLLDASYEEAEHLCSCIVKVFEAHGQAERLLKVILRSEVEAAVAASDFLLQNRPANKLWQAYARLPSGARYLRSTLQGPISALVKAHGSGSGGMGGSVAPADLGRRGSTSGSPLGSSPERRGSGMAQASLPVAQSSSFEVMEHRLLAGEDLRTNTVRLNQASQLVFDAIFYSIDQMPAEFKEVLQSLHEPAVRLFPNSWRGIVLGLVFLRFFCPGIVAPKALNVCDVDPPAGIQRGLILVAKTLQVLAAGIPAHQSLDRFVQLIRPFLERNESRVDELCSKMLLRRENTRICQKAPDLRDQCWEDAVVDIHIYVQEHFLSLGALLGDGGRPVASPQVPNVWRAVGRGLARVPSVPLMQRRDGGLTDSGSDGVADLKARSLSLRLPGPPEELQERAASVAHGTKKGEIAPTLQPAPILEEPNVEQGSAGSKEEPDARVMGVAESSFPALHGSQSYAESVTGTGAGDSRGEDIPSAAPVGSDSGADVSASPVREDIEPARGAHRHASLGGRREGQGGVLPHQRLRRRWTTLAPRSQLTSISLAALLSATGDPPSESLMRARVRHQALLERAPSSRLYVERLLAEGSRGRLTLNASIPRETSAPGNVSAVDGVMAIAEAAFDLTKSGWGKVDVCDARIRAVGSGSREIASKLAALTSAAVVLPFVDLTELLTKGVTTQTTFFINLYNSLATHIACAVGPPGERGRRSDFFGGYQYNVGGMDFSLSDVKDGILRAASGVASSAFLPSDPRAALSLSEFDFRIHFALCCHTPSSPKMRIYRAETLDADLDMAAADFVREHVEVAPNGSAVALPQLFEWFMTDFADSKAAVLHRLRSYFSSAQEAAFLGVSATTVYMVKPYVWSLPLPDDTEQPSLVLNTLHEWPDEVPARHACAVAESLMESALDLLQAAKLGPEASSKLASSLGIFVAQTAELRRLDIASLSVAERKVFFYNMYNTLALHIGLTHGSPAVPSGRRRFFGGFCYAIGRHTYCLDDMKHGVLRGNPLDRRRFTLTDPRAPAVIYEQDPRLHFVLHCLTLSSPPCRIYTVSGLEQELQKATQNYLALSDERVEVKADGKIVLPRVLEWYTTDFGKDTKDMLRWVAEFVPTPVRVRLMRLLEGDARLDVSFKPYRWEAPFMF